MSSILSDQADKTEYDYNQYGVKTITFDDLISNYGVTPSILKMDIEGAEKYALKSAIKTLESVRHLEAEIHDIECEHALMAFKDFNFEDSGAENMGNVTRFVLTHPFKTMRLEYNNGFRTAKRIVSARKSTVNRYPKIFYGSK